MTVNDDARRLADRRIEQVTQDPALADQDGVHHADLGIDRATQAGTQSHTGRWRCSAPRSGSAYGWGPRDTILQCAPLTSDISVEEIFGAAICGAELIRSAAMKTGDLDALAGDRRRRARRQSSTCRPPYGICCARTPTPLTRSVALALRQIVVGGEAIRPSAVDKWVGFHCFTADLAGLELRSDRDHGRRHVSPDSRRRNGRCSGARLKAGPADSAENGVRRFRRSRHRRRPGLVGLSRSRRPQLRHRDRR